MIDPEPPDAGSRDRIRRAILIAAVVTTGAGVLHHAEHVVRGNIGWPLSAELNGFSYSLLIYPIALVGLWLAARGPLAGWYHAVAAAGGLALVGLTHFVPAVGDPITGVYGHYAPASALVGFAAVGIVVVLIGSLAALLVLGVRAHLLERGASAHAGR